MILFSTEVLKAHGMTAYHLAKITGIPVSSIYKYRDGTLVPHLANARRISLNLGVPVNELEFKGELNARIKASLY